MKEVYIMEGLTFKKINKYQTLVSSENHQIILTDMIKKYTHFLTKAKINAVVSMIVGLVSSIFAVYFIHKAVSSFSGPAEILLIIGAIVVTVMCVSIFNSSRWDIFRFTRFLKHYDK